MRIFPNCEMAVSELKRELKEMGVEVKLQTMQDINVEGNDDYTTMELLGYTYRITVPHKDKEKLFGGFHKLNADNVAWAHADFKERIGRGRDNPGQAWKWREAVWKPFLHDGKFSYSYPERINDQVEKCIETLAENPSARNAMVVIWDPTIDQDRMGGKQRVPCSISYHPIIRDGKLNMIYYIRSNDLMTHWCFDVWMAVSTQEYIAGRLGLEVGWFQQNIDSLHAYKKDLSGIF